MGINSVFPRFGDRVVDSILPAPPTPLKRFERTGHSRGWASPWPECLDAILYTLGVLTLYLQLYQKGDPDRHE